MPPGYRPPRRPRPINRNDTALTTGLPLNPNGTYVANPYPSTAAAGAQGGYGSMLPQVNVGRSRLPNQAGTIESYNVNAFLHNIIPNIHNAVQSFQTPMPTIPYASASTPPVTSPIVGASSGNYNVNQRGRGFQNTPSASGSSVLDNYAYIQQSGQVGTNVLDYIVSNPAAYDNLSPAQKDTVDQIIQTQTGGAGGGGGAGNNDFMNTKFMQQNVANNVAFENQLRWDPQRKKYVQIGKLIREGKLDKQGHWHKVKSHRGRGPGKAAAAPSTPAVTETTGGFAGSYGVVNFNTATG